MDRRSGNIDRRSPEASSCRALVLLALVVPLLLALPSAAEAQFHVTQPDVVKGEATVGDHAAAYDGPGTDEKLDQAHEIEATYAFTERLELVGKGIFQQPIGGALEAKNYQIGPQYEIIERHGEGLGLAVRALYEFAAEDDQPDEIVFGPIARLVIGKNSGTLNTFFLEQVGEDADRDSVELKINWQLRREFTKHFGFGVEGYGDIKDLAHAGTFNDQLHRVGPVLYLDLRGLDRKEVLVRGDAEEGIKPSLRLAAGALFGLSEATSDVTFKLDLWATF